MSKKTLNTWDTSHPTHTIESNKIANITDRLLGNKFKGINDDVMRAFSLYNFVLKHINDPTEELRTKITQNGKPLFSDENLNSIVRVVRSQVNTPYAKHILRTEGKIGGGKVNVVQGKAVKAVPVAQTVPVQAVPVQTAQVEAAQTAQAAQAEETAHPLDNDSSRSKFWDRIIRKIMRPVVKQIPSSWDGVLWYTFILYSLEQNQLFGPFLATAMDTITLSLPVVAELVAETAGELIGLAPVPYASQAGDIIGYVISLVFVLFAVFLNVSRKHFGSAFMASMGVIPVIGDVLMSGARMFEVGAERYLENRKRLLKSVELVSPTAEGIAEYYSPSEEMGEKEAPTLNPDIVIPKIKQEIIHYGMEQSGLADIIDQIPTELPTAESLEKMALTKVKSGITNSITSATNKTIASAKAGITNSITSATNKTIASAKAKTGILVASKKGGSRKKKCSNSCNRRKTRKH